MKLTKEEFDFCAQPAVEKNLSKARAKMNYPIGRVAVEKLCDIYRRVGGVEPPKASSCSRCELKVKAKVAEWYFADKEEKARKAAARAAKEAEKEAQKGVAVQAAEQVAQMAEKPRKRATTKKKEAEV